MGILHFAINREYRISYHSKTMSYIFGAIALGIIIGFGLIMWGLHIASKDDLHG